ncbi:YtpR family tRNA-binding protein [Tuberibacillus sp. Marseille-P3662]|uniref:YtpR family tRNA-binding protein n=1 Tax=Tuberibacillus sp. Marseille-P3662 TaxID=1965358 RepID=UPI000A1CE3EC|nr:DUF4479 family protein [Tuberibacillus sp. Marseille-P3662]
MNIFYNPAGIGDTLIVTMNTSVKGERRTERRNNVARIYDDKNDKTLGYNIFNASHQIGPIDEYGVIELDEPMARQLNQQLEAEHFNPELSADGLPMFITGHVIEKNQHPDADKLSVCQVDIGRETLQIVCGAPNVEKGLNVVVARVGAVMPSGMLIKDSKLRGVASTGMICSAKELGLANAPEKKGILELPSDVDTGISFYGQMDHESMSK